VNAIRIVLLLVCITFSDFSEVKAQPETNNMVAVGIAAVVKGVVTSQSDLRPLETLARGSVIYLQDMIETTERSLLVIKFNDGGKLTLRPNSLFEIKEYDETPGQEKETFALLKGGLRAVTGAIGKAKGEEVKYVVRNATIGIRGTDFRVRLCDDCGADKKNVAMSPAGLDRAETNAINDELTIKKKDGSKREVSREELDGLLDGTYVSVIEGVIRFSKGDWYIDIGAGDACFEELREQTEDDDDEALNCFIRNERLEDYDPYLSGDEVKLTMWNQYGSDSAQQGDAICEIY
jgi:hypothetical protein